MDSPAILALWGVGGAFLYAAPGFGLAMWASALSDVVTMRRARLLAGWNFLVAMATGAMFAAAFADPLCRAVATGIMIGGFPLKFTVEPQTGAMLMGWGANRLAPRLLRWVGSWADKGGNGGELK